MKGTLRERLLSRLIIDPDSDCLLWTGCLNSRGYGVIGVNGRRELVHRVAWELEHGPIAEGLTIDHVHAAGCRYKHCANVAHLEPVTAAENNRRSHATGLPRKPGGPRPRPRPEPDDTYWIRFGEWASHHEWADLTPEVRTHALGVIRRSKKAAS